MNADLRNKLRCIIDTQGAGEVTDPVTFIEQISYLIYLKLLDEQEAQREQPSWLGSGKGRPALFPEGKQRYRWSEWRFETGMPLRDFLSNDVFPYMATLVREQPQVADYFRDAVLEITDPSELELLIAKIDEIQFASLGIDVRGNIFEYLLTHLGQSARNGQFRTPRQIRSCMVRMVDPCFGDTIYDPACGTAGFLVDSVYHLLAEYSAEPQEVPIYGEDWLENRGQTLQEVRKEIPNLQTYHRGAGERIPDWARLEASLFGHDVSRQILRIATMNLVLHGLPAARLKRANTLSETGGLNEDDLCRRYKIILSNPPFTGVLPKASIRKDLPTSSRRCELLFLGVMMQALAPGGRCAVVLPEGLLSGRTAAHKELRKKLLADFELQAVVSLPATTVGPHAQVKTALLVFRRPDEGVQPALGKVWFYEVTHDGYEPARISAGTRPETPNRNEIPAMLEAWGSYKGSGFAEPPGVEAKVVLKPGSDEPKCWWAGLDTVAANDWNLAAGPYRPRVAEKVPEDDPSDLIRECLVMEQEIEKGLQELLVELEGWE